MELVDKIQIKQTIKQVSMIEPVCVYACTILEWLPWGGGIWAEIMWWYCHLWLYKSKGYRKLISVFEDEEEGQCGQSNVSTR